MKSIKVSDEVWQKLTELKIKSRANRIDDVIKKMSQDFSKKRVVYTYACGDILHWGHIQYFKKAKKRGGYLIVGVLTKEAIMEKKPAPILSYKERAKVVESLDCVDSVVPQTTYSPLPNVKRIKPDILVESSSHSKEAIKEAKKVMASIGGRVAIIPYYPYQSSSSIKQRIKESA
jgi:rfaE bifunctional protein nucleotidyltransferase chain/domain